MKTYREIKFGTAERKRRGRYITCEICAKEFYVYPSRLRQAQRQGAIIRFCSASCYGQGKQGDGNPFWGKKHSPELIQYWKENPPGRPFKEGEDNPNAKRFGSDYVYIVPSNSSTMQRWRRHLMATRGAQCEQCGWGQYPDVLNLQHKDRDRGNNTAQNLMVVCPTCHHVDHYLAGDGPFAWRNQKPDK